MRKNPMKSHDDKVRKYLSSFSATPRVKVATARLFEEALQLKRKIDSTKPLYARLDAITEELVRQQVMEYGMIKVVDNFFDVKTGRPKNTAWKATGVRRYELKFPGER